MKKLMLIIFVMFALTIVLSAQDAGDKVSVSHPVTANHLFLWSIIIGTIGLTAAAIGGAFAQSKALRTAVENIGRNPAAADSIRGVLIIGLALIESLVIYVLLVDLILFFVNWGKYTVG
ncbi:MAG: ATP synthase F0 subunit C [bacterium]|nr:ATP synthase F0 subunit C [bacterium]